MCMIHQHGKLLTVMFEGDSRGISLGLCTGGVNPFSHLRCSYSMLPIVMSLMNLPRDIRHDFRNNVPDRNHSWQ